MVIHRKNKRKEEKQMKIGFNVFLVTTAVIAIVMTFLVLLSVGCTETTATSKQDKAVKSKVEATKEAKEDVKAIRVDAKVLSKAFDDNEIKANRLYKGKLARVTGKVDSIGEMLGQTFITLESHKEYSICSVQCFFKEADEIQKIENLKNGDAVTVGGVIDGKSMNVSVNECVFLK